jgi:hypothetical protein
MAARRLRPAPNEQAGQQWREGNPGYRRMAEAREAEDEKDARQER